VNKPQRQSVNPAEQVNQLKRMGKYEEASRVNYAINFLGIFQNDIA
jgi:hypothetical protein